MNALNVIQILGIVALMVATFFTVKNYRLVQRQRKKVILEEIRVGRLRAAAFASLTRSSMIQGDMMSVASMTAADVAVKLEEERKCNPERYYKGMGAPEAEDLSMDPFVSGSYDYGVLVGALWMARLVESGISDVKNRKRYFVNGVEVSGAEMTGEK